MAAIARNKRGPGRLSKSDENWYIHAFIQTRKGPVPDLWRIVQKDKSPEAKALVAKIRKAALP